MAMPMTVKAGNPQSRRIIAKGVPSNAEKASLSSTASSSRGVSSGTEIGVDPTVRHGADLGLVPIVVQDACGAGNREAAQRALANLAFVGGAIMTDAATFCAAIGGEPAAR
jgi:hypothetical protein